MTMEISAKLLVSDADAAVAFYSQALEATLAFRAADERDVVNHAELVVGSTVLTLAQSVEEWGWIDPLSLGGSPVLITVTVPDPDVLADRMVDLGATLVIPVENRPYGKRQGRVRDPFGHLWVISGELG